MDNQKSEGTQAHSKDCQCTYCNSKEVEGVWNRDTTFKSMKLGDLGDGLGNVKPEVHVFAQQVKEEVLDQIKKSETFRSYADERIAQDYIKAMKDYPEPAEPKLMFEDTVDNSWEQPVLPRCNKDVPTGACLADEEVTSLWRKLSGVKPEERVVTSTTRTLVNAITRRIERQFEHLDVDWSEDCYNKCLTINGAKTSIRTTLITEAYYGLRNICSHQEAVQFISGMVVKKLRGLFL